MERQPASNASTITIEGGEDFDDDEPFVEGGDEPNFNRADGTSDAAPVEVRRPYPVVVLVVPEVSVAGGIAAAAAGRAVAPVTPVVVEAAGRSNWSERLK